MKCKLLYFVFFSLPVILSAQDTTRTFVFGHSLLDHRPPAIATPSDETTVPHWIFLLAQEAGYPYAAGGQYGFLPQHANVPPISQWGHDIVPGVWESDTEPFSDADIDQILITAGNFMQWQAPSLPYPGEPDSITPISTTLAVVDWVTLQEDSLQIFIYENWPDMVPYLSGGSFPPTASDLTNYYAYTEGEFHDWWITYHDSVVAASADVKVRMIPVRPDVEIAPKKTSVSIRRAKQFALIKPATKSRIDLGLKFKNKDTSDRLGNSGPFGTMCSHRVQLTEASQVHSELTTWLKDAYEEAGS